MLRHVAHHVRAFAHEYAAVFALICMLLGLYGSLQQADERAYLTAISITQRSSQ